jgi:hypothetical protein
MRSGLTRLISSGKRAFMLKLKKEHLKYRSRPDSVANLPKNRPKIEKVQIKNETVGEHLCGHISSHWADF